MSLIDCPECAQQISDYSRWCPHCGYPRADSAPLRTHVKDIEMSFRSMMFFMIKWTIAALPALIILFFLGALLTGFFGAAFRL